MQTPFKIIVDSRAASQGSSNRFAVTLPEAIQLDKDYVMFVSQASVSNSFLSVGATLKKTVISIGLSELRATTRSSAGQNSQRAITWLKSLPVLCRRP